MPSDFFALLKPRTYVQLAVIESVVAAMWILMQDDLPHWFLWLAIPLGLVFVAAVNLNTSATARRARVFPWIVGVIYLATLGYAFKCTFHSAIEEHIETTSLFYRPDNKMIPMVSAIVTLTNTGPYTTNGHDFVLSTVETTSFMGAHVQLGPA